MEVKFFVLGIALLAGAYAWLSMYRAYRRAKTRLDEITAIDAAVHQLVQGIDEDQGAQERLSEPDKGSPYGYIPACYRDPADPREWARRRRVTRITERDLKFLADFRIHW